MDRVADESHLVSANDIKRRSYLILKSVSRRFQISYSRYCNNSRYLDDENYYLALKMIDIARFVVTNIVPIVDLEIYFNRK